MGVKTLSSPRRTQVERTAATRERLMMATMECVVERGYAATSTTEVARRAGVSRGAQVHHFPTKADLMLAALQWMFERRLEEFRSLFENLAPQDRTMGRAVDLLWTQFQGTEFIGWLEMAVASRTDPVLGTRFQELNEWFNAECERNFFEFLQPAGDDRAFAELALSLTFATLDGAALARIVNFPWSGDKAIEALRGLAVLFSTPGERPGTKDHQ
jgi:AcrR family transcriptional regulator